MTPFKKLVIFISAFTLARLFVAGSFELALDDGYYWLWSQHLSPGYFDHPPMVAVVIWAGTLFGQSEIFVRLGAVLLAAVSTYLLYRIAEKLFNSAEAGWHSAWIANLCLIFSVGALTTTPDSPLIPFYLCAMILFYDAAKAENGAWLKWLSVGVFVGLAMLSKYTAVFFFPGAVLYLALSPDKRRWFFRPEPYVAALVSAVVFSPVIFWNAEHNWISLAFQAKHGLEHSGGNPLGRFLEFAGLQAVIYSIGIFFFLMAGIVTAIRRCGIFSKTTAEGQGKDTSLFLVSMAAPTLIFFTFNSFRATVEGNWPVLGFLPLFIQAGGMTEEWLKNRGTKKLLTASIVTAVLLTAFLHVQIVDPIIPHPKRFEISRRVFGWRQLAGAVDAERSSFPAKFLIADRHQIAGLLTYYTDDHLPAHVIGRYNKLRYTFLPGTDTYAGGNAIYVVEEERDNSKALEKVFEKVEKARTVVIERKGELIRRFLIYRCYNYRGGLDDL
ncbi:MAG: glycosyltransferase family 39 protein [Nitrospinae bacterium]|nr:glycosyltransferase family 39 protein [Nitrospinota bacterium]